MQPSARIKKHVQTPESHFKKSEKLELKNNFEQAFKHFKRAIDHKDSSSTVSNSKAKQMAIKYRSKAKEIAGIMSGEKGNFAQAYYANKAMAYVKKFIGFAARNEDPDIKEIMQECKRLVRNSGYTVWDHETPSLPKMKKEQPAVSSDNQTETLDRENPEIKAAEEGPDHGQEEPRTEKNSVQQNPPASPKPAGRDLNIPIQEPPAAVAPSIQTSVATSILSGVPSVAQTPQPQPQPQLPESKVEFLPGVRNVEKHFRTGTSPVMQHQSIAAIAAGSGERANVGFSNAPAGGQTTASQDDRRPAVARRKTPGLFASAVKKVISQQRLVVADDSQHTAGKSILNPLAKTFDPGTSIIGENADPRPISGNQRPAPSSPQIYRELQPGPAQDQVEILRQSNCALKDELQKLKTRCNRFQDDIASLQAAVARLTATVERLESKRDNNTSERGRGRDQESQVPSGQRFSL